MNAAELATRLTILEQKVEKLSPTLDIQSSAGLAVPGIDGAIGVQLIGVTTAQRTALGVKLATFPEVKHILVYDKDQDTFYTWSGQNWV